MVRRTNSHWKSYQDLKEVIINKPTPEDNTENKGKHSKVEYDENNEIIIKSSLVSHDEALKVAKLRQTLNLTRADLARKVHIAENEITLIENGKAIRNAGRMSKIFNYLRQTIADQKNNAISHLQEPGWTFVH